LADASYASVIGEIAARRDALEKAWEDAQGEFEAKAYAAYKDDPAKAVAMLTEYTDKQAGLAWRGWRKLFNDLLS
jgi:hypothetical protein